MIDGIVYAGLVGLGFAMTENVLYYGRGAAEDGVVGAVGTFVARGLLSPFAHPIFTAMIGIGLGVASMSRSRNVRIVAPLAGLAAAMVLHSIWNTAAGSGLFFGAYLLVFVPVALAIGAIVMAGLRREGRVHREVPAWRAARRGGPCAVVAGRAPPLAPRAAARGGRRGGKAVSAVQHVAAELALLRAQVSAARSGGTRRRAAREAGLRAELARGGASSPR